MSLITKNTDFLSKKFKDFRMFSDFEYIFATVKTK